MFERLILEKLVSAFFILSRLDKKIRYKVIFWYIFRPKKYKLFREWLGVGTTIEFAFKKAKYNVPYFYNEEDKKQWIRQQKLKKILNTE